MSEFTPGPWRVHATDETLVIGPDRHEVACMSGNYASDYEAMGANARLIAVAPEMYELLRDLAEHHPRYNLSWPRITALLAKAEGRS